MKVIYKYHQRVPEQNRGFVLDSILRPIAAIVLGGLLLIACSPGEGNSYYDNYRKNKATNEAAQAAGLVATDGKGYGPITTVVLEDTIDEQLAMAGKAAFDWKCAACHASTAERAAGPGLAGITKRRKPEWVMNMMLNPEQMTQHDPVAKQLLNTHLIQMTNQQLNEHDARALLEYFRKNDAGS